MKTTITFLAAALLLVGTTQAQDDPKSKAILDKLVEKNKGYTSFEATFTSRLQNKEDGLDVKQSGKAQVRGKKFRLQLDDNTIMMDGTTMWTYSKESNEVTISDPSEMDQEMDPSKLFTQYETGFKSAFVEERKEATGQVLQVIKLFPLEPAKKAFHTVMLTIDKATSEPREVKVMYKEGNIVTYTLQKFTPNVSLPESTFTFDKSKYPGVEVNDMR